MRAWSASPIAARSSHLSMSERSGAPRANRSPLSGTAIFLAIVADSETAVEAAAAVASAHTIWNGAESPAPLQQEAN
jgi:hypothetical protein